MSVSRIKRFPCQCRTIGIDGILVLCLHSAAEPFYRVAELRKRLALVSGRGITDAVKGTLQRHRRHGKRTVERRGISLIHELNTLCGGLRTRCVQVNLQVLHRLQCHTQLQVIGIVRTSSCHGVAQMQPSLVLRLIDIRVTHKAKGEVESRRQGIGTSCLSECLTDSWHESRKTHGVLVPIGEADAAHRHCQTSKYLCSLIPSLLIQWILRSDGHLHFHCRVNLTEDLYLVLVHLLIFQRIRLPVFCLCRKYEALRLLSMTQLKCRVRHQRDFLLEAL